MNDVSFDNSAYRHKFSRKLGERCDRIRDVFMRECQRPIYATEMRSGELVGVFPSLGALCMGHILVVPETDYHSIAEMPPEDLAEFSALLRDFRVFLKKGDEMYYVAAEHGAAPAAAVSQEGRACFQHQAGACMDHAHVHLIPVHSRLFSLMAEYRRQCGLEDYFLDDVSEIKNFTGIPYLMLAPASDKILVWVNPVERLPQGSSRQFIRRILYDLLPESAKSTDGHDWRKNPALEHVHSTQALMDRLFNPQLY